MIATLIQKISSVSFGNYSLKSKGIKKLLVLFQFFHNWKCGKASRQVIHGVWGRRGTWRGNNYG